MSGSYGRLAPAKFGFAWGLMWAIGLLLMGWSAWLWGYGMAFVALFASVYIGYGPTFLGAVLGAVWGFIDFFIFAWLVALIYNGCHHCCKKSSGESSI